MVNEENIDLLKDEELDAAITKYVLGWKYWQVPADINGKNKCQILTPNGKIPEGISLPPRGKIHEAYLVPSYSTDIDEALHLAKSQGMTSINIECSISELPSKICRDILKL